ncbi:bifunctional adenosylcobinamide kinase/adenosylcobinamide-phosphate guanylyltransferase [Pseudalkalibacillus berkeleyi]|uniref:Bifunctional adenosylcobinamide kinase/adenosylcobinamide-phosphate guanylyltransferase n=1 Tax=Pseudalkalibacillus berkeleyi TaxID=1069813 RepID=A0ABS9H0K7_9BACL|nr:bifunctional adenosylcobinamide kinase/adenosylcobinamide-phosphate guanylyltransferase [Pseudalkalibacillus berkeleyi]MCF6137475.1 bifunctional adenosylcobinamide kinase/adenosylcobinamide-phosphate guanylyltransferase [Pseudalkalibacillus berkeleyi]
MHFVTGGAFNGKRSWVTETYQLLNNNDYCWISAYKDHPIPIDLYEHSSSLVILEGIEIWIQDLVKNDENTKERCNTMLLNWLSWEQDRNNQLIVIGSDITKGIVPVSSIDRIWRDRTGWFYQDIASRADKMDIIWYGMRQQMK